MRARLNIRILTLASIVVGMLAVPTAAFAYAPTGDDFITCVAGGDSNVECTAGVFDAGTDVTVTTPEGDQTVTADGDGTISFDFDATDPGAVEVTLRGTFDGEVKVLNDQIANVADDGTVIANAGADAGLLALGALGALVLGGGALYAARRTKSDVAA